MLSNVLVAIAVVASVCYCLWSLGPRRMRDALRARLHKMLPNVFGDPRGISTASGCDACGGCQAAAGGDPSRDRPRTDHTFVLKRR